MIKKELPKIITTCEVLKRLNIPRHKLQHLFNAGKLKRDDFQKTLSGDTVYTEEDIDKIKELIFK